MHIYSCEQIKGKQAGKIVSNHIKERVHTRPRRARKGREKRPERAEGESAICREKRRMRMCFQKIQECGRIFREKDLHSMRDLCIINRIESIGGRMIC